MLKNIWNHSVGTAQPSTLWPQVSNTNIWSYPFLLSTDTWHSTARLNGCPHCFARLFLIIRFFSSWLYAVDCVLSTCRKVVIPMYRLCLHSLYGLHWYRWSPVPSHTAHKYNLMFWQGYAFVWHSLDKFWFREALDLLSFVCTGLHGCSPTCLKPHC